MAGPSAGPDPIIGRAFELAELVAGLDASRRGGGHFFLLTGEPGVGKTRLAEAVAETAVAAGNRVRWGRCRSGGAAPYRPWAEVLRAEVADDSVPVGPSAAHLLPLIPEVAERLSGDGVRRPSEQPGARVALFHAVTDLLAAGADAGGRLVVIEDLDEADEASLRLLHFVVDRLSASPLLLIGTYRAGEGRRDLSLVARQARRIVLTGLDEGGVEELLKRTAPGIVAGDVARRVLHATDGNPFLVQEVVRILGAGSTVVPVPGEARHLIRARMASIPVDLREVLLGAAVLGPEFDLDTLASLLELSEETVALLLGAAADLHVVRAVGAGRWSFGHGLLRDALYEELRPSALASLHRRAGRAIKTRPPAERTAQAFELAHHFYAAARDGDGEAAVESCGAAGDFAMTAYAFEEAATLYGRALEALGLATPVDEGRRHALLVAMARSKERGGDLAQACEAWRRALMSARAVGAAELLAETALGYTAVVSSTGGDARSVLEESRAVLPSADGSVLARLLVRLGAEVARRHRELGHHLGDEALEMARRLGDPETSWAVLSEWLAGASEVPKWGRRRVDVAREALALAEQVGDPERIVSAHQRLALELFRAGDVGAATGHLTLATAGADALGQPLLQWESQSRDTALALLEGRLADAERLAHEARSVGDGIELAPVEARFQEQLRRVHMDQGRFADVLDGPGGQAVGHPGCHRADLALSNLWLGRRDDAGRMLADLVASSDRLCCLAGAAELCWLLDDPTTAAPLYEALLPHAGLHVVAAEGGCSLGAGARYVAQLAATLGRFDEADERFDDAHRMHERLGAPAWLARSRADHARMLVRRGGPGDGDRARSLTDAAAEAFEALGMGPHAQRTRSIVTAGGSAEAGPAGGGAVHRARLLQEGDYWAFEYGGAVVRLRDGKGVRYLVALLCQPGRELHAVDLAGGGSAGGEATALSPEAKKAYRRRMQELRDDLDEATANNDPERAARAQHDMDRLLAELSAAVGQGAEGRSVADAERARQSVTRAVKGTVERIAEADAALGMHLRSTVRTGVYSSYVPDPRAPIVWEEA